ncbi:hypothetical protein ACMUEP_02515, partial [Enterobacter nematophilus]
LQAIGSGMSLHPYRPRPLGASVRLAPALRKRFGDLQPDQGVAESFTRSETTLLLLLINYWGFLNPVGEGQGEGISPLLTLNIKNIRTQMVVVNFL